MTTCEAQLKQPQHVPLHPDDPETEIQFGEVFGDERYDEDRYLAIGDLASQMAMRSRSQTSSDHARLVHALDTQLHKDVVLKLHIEQTRQKQIAADREIQTHTALGGEPGVVDTYDTGIVDLQGTQYRFLSFPFARYGCVDAVARQSENRLKLARETAIGISTALDTLSAHDVIHGDIKPRNMLVTETGVALTDFGIVEAKPEVKVPRFAKRLGTTAMWESATAPRDKILGTIGYIAPEYMTRGREALSPKADAFALGVSLFYIATGNMPFNNDTVCSYVQGVFDIRHPRLNEQLRHCPREFAAVVDSLIEVDPNNRANTDDIRHAASLLPN